MKNQSKLLFLTMVILVAWSLAVCSSHAAGPVNATVRIIHASSEAQYMDPGLGDLASELQSVFRYTSYRLLGRKSIALNYNDTGRIALPGNRSLELSPISFENGRIQFKINILKRRASVFATEILLKNASSITIGGPGHEDGYLLFNISGTAL